MRRDDAPPKTHDRLSRMVKPRLEGLEDRMLLYSATGGAWTQPVRVTYSFVPDGTSIGGPTSTLNATLNAQVPGWQAVFQQAAAVWEQVANINLVQVSDNGAALGVGSYQQGDPNNGDIRISAIPLGTGELASAFLPPPLNGCGVAGDIIFNSSQNWTPSTGYDLTTVAIHEFGHALGVGHSAITSADMYAYYNATKSYLTTDDVSGIQSIYSARRPDAWTVATGNTTKANAADVSSQLGTNGQASLANLNITAPTVVNWFKVTVPSTTTGSMVVTMQSTNLSELSPRIQIYNAAGLTLTSATAPGTYGSTVTATIKGVVAGQVYYIRTMAASSGATGAGGYGLQLNFGSAAQAPIAPPNTTVANQPDSGGGSFGEHGWGPTQWIHNGPITIGTVTGIGDNLMVSPRIVHHQAHPAGPVKHHHHRHHHS